MNALSSDAASRTLHGTRLVPAGVPGGRSVTEHAALFAVLLVLAAAKVFSARVRA
jgi:hypothetical protein